MASLEKQRIEPMHAPAGRLAKRKAERSGVPLVIREQAVKRQALSAWRRIQQTSWEPRPASQKPDFFGQVPLVLLSTAELSVP